MSYVARLYGTRETAASAVEALKQHGFKDAEIRVVTAEAAGAPAEGADPVLERLNEAGVTGEHAAVYAEHLRRGETLVVVQPPFGMGFTAETVMGRFAAVSADLPAPPLPQDADSLAAPLSTALGWRVLSSEPAPLSTALGWATIKPQPAHSATLDAIRRQSSDPAPLSRLLGLKTLSDDPAPLSSLFKWKTLWGSAAALSDKAKWKTALDDPAPLSGKLGMRAISANPAPLSSALGLPVLSGAAAPPSSSGSAPTLKQD